MRRVGYGRLFTGGKNLDSKPIETELEPTMYWQRYSPTRFPRGTYQTLVSKHRMTVHTRSTVNDLECDANENRNVVFKNVALGVPVALDEPKQEFSASFSRYSPKRRRIVLMFSDAPGRQLQSHTGTKGCGTYKELTTHI